MTAILLPHVSVLSDAWRGNCSLAQWAVIVCALYLGRYEGHGFMWYLIIVMNISEIRYFHLHAASQQPKGICLEFFYASRVSIYHRFVIMADKQYKLLNILTIHNGNYYWAILNIFFYWYNLIGFPIMFIGLLAILFLQ